MAVGDAAAAAGMAIVAGSTAANEIDTEINRTRDYLTDVAYMPDHTHRIDDILTMADLPYAPALQAQLDRLEQRLIALHGPW